MQRKNSDQLLVSSGEEPMRYDELRALAMSIYGKRWRRPLARALGCDKRLIYFFESGERRITPAIAVGVRAESARAGLSGAALVVR
jgi:hypothetical protein